MATPWPRGSWTRRCGPWASGWPRPKTLLDLEAIIVGGGLGDRLGKPFVDRVAEAMAPQLFVPDSPPAVLVTDLTVGLLLHSQTTERRENPCTPPSTPGYPKSRNWQTGRSPSKRTSTSSGTRAPNWRRLAAGLCMTRTWTPDVRHSRMVASVPSSNGS